MKWSEISTYSFQYKGKEVEVEIMRPLLEGLVEEPKVGAVEGHQVDQFLIEGNLVKRLKDVEMVVLEEEESEDAV